MAASDWEAERDDHVYTLDLPGKSTADCRLEFTPKEVSNTLCTVHTVPLNIG